MHCSGRLFSYQVKSQAEHKWAQKLVGGLFWVVVVVFKKSKRAVFFMNFWTYTLLLNVTIKDIKDKKCSRAAWWQQDLLNQTSDSSFHQSWARLVRHRLTLILSLSSRIHRKVDYTLHRQINNSWGFTCTQTAEHEVWKETRVGVSNFYRRA